MTELLRSGYTQHFVGGAESDTYGSVAYSVTLEENELGSETVVDGELEMMAEITTI
jgi:hypothetical protein